MRTIAHSGELDVHHMTSRARIAFVDYMTMGSTRSLVQLADRYQLQTDCRPPTRHLSQLKRWSVRYGWRALAEEHDRRISAEIARQDAEARIAEAERERRHRLALADAARHVAMRAMQRLDQAGTLSGHTAVMLLEFADKVKRLDLGDPTSRAEITSKDGVPISPVVIYIPDNGRDPGPPPR